ncbi:MAG: radical SAM protein, partial [Candidatus Coatesbacteria bacterium]
MLVTPITDFTTRLQEMPTNGQPRTIYIHTPFCTHNCTFCNLNRRRERPPEEYADLIVREIKTYAAYRYVSEGRYDAIYFGGGTPTSLSPKALQKI